jgi:hypothetical protein
VGRVANLRADCQSALRRRAAAQDFIPPHPEANALLFPPVPAVRPTHLTRSAAPNHPITQSPNHPIPPLLRQRMPSDLAMRLFPPRKF